jgi:hypothetical protein
LYTQKIGTLALTGTATIGDVINGKTFYNTDPKTQLIGTFIPSFTVLLPSIVMDATGNLFLIISKRSLTVNTDLNLKLSDILLLKIS